MKTIKITVYGRVQGVGFRYTTKKIADTLGITGTVHNNEDGSVTILATSEEIILNDFKQQIINNPSPTSVVKTFDYEQLPLQTFKGFEII